MYSYNLLILHGMHLENKGVTVVFITVLWYPTPWSHIVWVRYSTLKFEKYNNLYYVLILTFIGKFLGHHSGQESYNLCMWCSKISYSF